MSCFQTNIRLNSYPRGFHLITDEIIKAIEASRDIRTGIAHIFIRHTSGSLSINENADPSVRKDFESHFNEFVPENAPYYIHTYEGPDDMPAHIKASLLGSSVTVPIAHGELDLGTWQGIYLCEHRDKASGRNLTITLLGD
ncbi:MAG: YjbQ family protein [Candidatus Lindowbacteria bacterium]|nr:YjbQ family protein [Candidatus Lindowbacteria bacterium]